LYESGNRQSAARVLEFLKAENIQIYTYDVVLTLYASQQEDLFGSIVAETAPRVQPIARDTWRVNANVLARARELGIELAARTNAANTDG
jgi:hypothetical protein